MCLNDSIKVETGYKGESYFGLPPMLYFLWKMTKPTQTIYIQEQLTRLMKWWIC